MNSSLKFKSQIPQTKIETNLGPVQFRKVRVVDLEKVHSPSKNLPKEKCEGVKGRTKKGQENLKRKIIKYQNVEKSKKKWWSCSNSIIKNKLKTD